MPRTTRTRKRPFSSYQDDKWDHENTITLSRFGSLNIYEPQHENEPQVGKTMTRVGNRKQTEIGG